MSARYVINFIRESDLIKKAAASQNLTLCEEPRKDTSCPVFQSEVVAGLAVDKDFLIAARKYGSTFEPGTKPPHNEMVYLSGNSNQKGAEVFESDCWAWKRTETAPQLTLYFHLWVVEGRRGVCCEPHIWGNCSGGACHRPTVAKLTKCIAEYLPDAHPLIKGLDDKELVATIHWSTIGLGGVKSVGNLFDDLYRENKTVIELANSSLSPFDPSPKHKYMTLENKDRLFVLEAEQTKLFKKWREQLQGFKDSLV